MNTDVEGAAAVQTRPSDDTGWLRDLIAHLGKPVLSPDARWTWREGDVGVLIEHRTVWQIVAWTPDRSVTVRSVEKPSDADTGRAVMLAGLRTLTPLSAAESVSDERTSVAGTRAHPEPSQTRRGDL